MHGTPKTDDTPAQTPVEQPEAPAEDTVPKADYDNLKACYDGLRGDVAELINKYR